MNFKDFFEDCKKQKAVGSQIRGTDLIVLKSLLSASPYSKLATKCEHFYWMKRRVSGYLRLGIFAFYQGRYIYLSKSQMAGKSTETHRSKVLQALRNIISPQIVEFRNSYDGNWICPLSGINLRNVEARDIHVDHKYSFKYLVEDWMALNKLDRFESLKVAGRAGRSRTLKDEALRQSWYDYHAEHAELQLAHAKANVKAGAKRG